MAKNLKNRTTLFMLHGFQRWFILSFTLYTAVFLTLLGTALTLWFRLIAKEVLNVSGVLSSTFATHVEHSMTRGAWFIGLIVFVLIALAAGQAVLFSRKIAGPLFAISKHFEKCERTGKLTPMQLRKNDLLHELEEKFNQLVERVNQKK